jgi:hypothetical protein
MQGLRVWADRRVRIQQYASYRLTGGNIPAVWVTTEDLALLLQRQNLTRDNSPSAARADGGVRAGRVRRHCVAAGSLEVS